MKKVSDVFVTLSHSQGLFVATLHFNLLQTSQSIAEGDLPAFCEKLAEVLRSTCKQVTPMPGPSSASIAHLCPHSVGVGHDRRHPIPNSSLGAIQTVLSEFIDELAEFDSLFLEAQEEEAGP